MRSSHTASEMVNLLGTNSIILTVLYVEQLNKSIFNKLKFLNETVNFLINLPLLRCRDVALHMAQERQITSCYSTQLDELETFGGRCRCRVQPHCALTQVIHDGLMHDVGALRL